jgi:Histidine phosphatase superfamily (branch 2)
LDIVIIIMKCLLTLSACLAAAAAQSTPDDHLGYVFEITRHGARAPLSSIDPTKFKVGVGMLTASGMRHRHLLGKFNRERYVKYYGLLDSSYNPNQIYVQSTAVDRTMQSGYAELMGLYPPGSGS